jgi:DNA-binding Lrp family transcriptional regulator
VDSLNFAIYRFLSPGGEARFWAGRRLIDPTITAREIAQRVGISESGVRARLRSLAQQGFLRGTTVIPNPDLFGARVFVVEVPIREVGEVERVFSDLALVEGMIFARDTLDEGSRHIHVHFAAENESVANRRANLIRRFSPSSQLRGPQPYWIPSCEMELSPMGWRVLHAAWSHPDATITETARRLRISLKTTARWYHQLIESRACWWTHGSDSEEFPLALLQVVVRDPARRAFVVERILREATAWMPVASDGLGVEPASPRTLIAGLVPADAPTVLEKLVRKCVELAEVANVHRTFPLGSVSYPVWIADRMAAKTTGRSGC